MSRGLLPGADTLGLIARAENVSLSWLVEGAGTPYLVRWYPTDEQCREYLDELLADEIWTAVHRLTDGGRVEVLVLHCPAEVEYREQTVPYTEIAVLAGGIGPATLSRLTQLDRHRVTLADTDTVAAVATGELAGTWPLLGEGGLLTTYEEVPRNTLRVAEPGNDYTQEGTDAISMEEFQLVKMYRRLDPHGRVRLKEVGDAFVAAGQRDRHADDDNGD